MQNVINLLDQLFQRTKNRKYIVDIADILLNSNNEGNEKQGLEILRVHGDTKELSEKLYINRVQYEVDAILNRKELVISQVRNSLTVIIPTMWKCPADYFKFNLDILSANKSVEKILIIDNSPQDNYLVIENKDKIQVIENETNIGVNPAWNQGIEQTSSDYYLLLNDDCLINTDIISAGVTILHDDKEVGIVNCHTKKTPLKHYPDDCIRLNVEYANHVGANPNGWFIMGRTEDYKPIPKELVYFYGDNLIHHNAVKAGKRVVKIISDYISHDVSTTVNKLDLYRKGLLETEGQFYKQHIGK